MQNPPGEVPCHCQSKFSPNCATSKAAYWLWSLRGSATQVMLLFCEIVVANEIRDSADVIRKFFGKGEGLTYQTRDALP